MPLTLSIKPFTDVVDMYGDADSSSSFSLSGHISVSLTSPSSLFVRRRSTTRVLLQSLTITFDGHSETVSPGTGYAPIRLCSITREMLPGGPVELSNEGQEESDEPCLWDVVFDIAVPGWLPTTSIHGDASLRAAGTSYALYATATFLDIDHVHSLFPIAKICGPLHPRARTVDAPRYPITLRRFVEPQPGSFLRTFPMSLYVVDTRRGANSEGSPARSIPSNVLEKIQVIASIPSAVSVDDGSFPFVLRVRARDLDDSERKRLKITEFSVDAEQVEVYRKHLSHADVDRYPIPSQDCQPPRLPLRNPHPIHALYKSGFLGSQESSVKRSFSILSPMESGRYIISGNGHVFFSAHQDGQSPPSTEDSWYILETEIPIVTYPCLRDWAGPRKRRITENSPLFSVEHFVHVVIHCEYDLADSDSESRKTALESLHFTLPMQHVNLPELTRARLGDFDEGESGDVRKTLPCSQSLPAYAQLFHPNGEQKIDHSIPLPLYKPPSACSAPLGFATHQR